MASRGQWIAVGLVLGVIGFAIGAALLLTPEITRIEPGARAPAYTVFGITTPDTVDIRDFRGEVVLLNVWATWCGPCEQEMPSMERLYQEMGPQGLRVVAVSVDQADPATVGAWVQERDLSFTVLHDPSGRIQQVYQTTGVQESFVVDREGVIVKKIIGATEWDHPAQKALFRRLLASE
jgi:peroxiredoxin